MSKFYTPKITIACSLLHGFQGAFEEEEDNQLLRSIGRGGREGSGCLELFISQVHLKQFLQNRPLWSPQNMTGQWVEWWMSGNQESPVSEAGS